MTYLHSVWLDTNRNESAPTRKREPSSPRSSEKLKIARKSDEGNSHGSSQCEPYEKISQSLIGQPQHVNVYVQHNGVSDDSFPPAQRHKSTYFSAWFSNRILTFQITYQMTACLLPKGIKVRTFQLGFPIVY